MSSAVSIISEQSEISDALSSARDVTVKFQIDETQTIAQAYRNTTAIADIRQDVADKFQLEVRFIVFKQYDEELVDTKVLREVCRNEFGVVEIQVDLTDEAVDNDVALDTSIYYSQYALNDIISVHIPAEMTRDGCPKDIIVEIEKKSMISKPYIGGFFNKFTNLEYHNAFTQTGPSSQAIQKIQNKYTRDTQTADVSLANLDTPCDHAIQCYGEASPKIFISDSQDYEVIPRECYKTYEERMREANIDRKVRLLQRNWRRFLWMRLVKESAEKYREMKAELQRQDSNRVNCNAVIETKSQMLQAIAESCPKTKQDFDILYARVNAWKVAEIERINEQYSGAPKIAELNGLLDREIKLLNEIEQKRLALRQQLHMAKTAKILDKLGKPVQWVGHRNEVIEMDTLRTQRARLLTAHYETLNSTTRLDERLPFLAKLVPIVANEANTKVPELIELLKREVTLLQSGIDAVEVLRQRQCLLFLDIIKDEENKTKEKPIKTQLCGKCETVRPVDDFEMETRCSVNVCKYCAGLNAPPVDKAVYLAILRSVRRDERRRAALSSFAFIIQENDVKFIVEQIWHGHSILSQCEKKSELRLPRFNISEDWSPWNCILLTDSEARMHVRIQDVTTVYEDNILKDIKNKLELGKSAFKQLKEVDCNFVESGEWWNAGMD